MDISIKSRSTLERVMGIQRVSNDPCILAGEAKKHRLRDKQFGEKVVKESCSCKIKIKFHELGEVIPHTGFLTP